MRFTSAALAILIFATFSVRAATINVPADEPNLATAITTATTGDTVVVAAGTYAVAVNIDEAGITLRLAGNITVNSLAGIAGSFIDLQGNTLTFGNATDTTCASDITGGVGSLIKLGTGIVTLSGNSNFTGGVTSNNGILVAGSSTALGTGTYTQNAGGTPRRLQLSNGVALANNIILNGSEPGAGQGQIEGPLTGSASISGNISITAATTTGGHVHGNAGLSISGTITSTVQFVHRDGTATYTGTITAPAVQHSQGTAHFNGAGVLPVAPFGMCINGTGTVSITGNQSPTTFTIGAHTSTLNILSGTFTIPSGITYTAGATTTVSSGAALTLQGGITFAAATTTFTLGTGSTLTVPGNLTQTNNNTVTISGGTMNLGGAVRTFNLNTTTNITTISSSITNGGIQKDNAGTLLLSGAASDFDMGFTLNGGIVRAGSNTALGLSTSAFVINSGALRLETVPGITLANPITINGGTPGATESIIRGANAVGTATLSGTITISGALTNGFHFRGSTGALALTGAINSSLPITQQDGTVTYSGGGTYPEFTANTGTINIGAVNGLNPGAIITLGLTGALTLNATSAQRYTNVLNFANSTNVALGGIVTLNGTNEIACTVNSYGNFTHDINGTLDLVAGSRTFNLADGFNLNDITLDANVINGTLVKTGPGQLTLSTGTNTQTSTQILAGVLSIDTDARLGSTTGSVVIDGGTLEVRGGITLSATRGIAIGPSAGSGPGTITVTAANVTTYNGVIANNGGGTGNLIKGNTGTLALGNANTYSGTTTVTGNGRLRLTGATAPGGSIVNSTSILVNSHSTLEVDNSGTANPDRFGSSTTLTLNDGNFYFAAPANTDRTESLSDLSVQGDSQITIISNANASDDGEAWVSFGAISIPGNLTLLRQGVTANDYGRLLSSSVTAGTTFPTANVFDGETRLTSFGGIYDASLGLIGDGVTTAGTFISTGAGAPNNTWTSTAAWTPPSAAVDADGIPDSNDVVIIQNNHNVLVNGAQEALGVTFNAAGAAGSGQLSSTGSLTVGARGITVTNANSNAPTISCGLVVGADIPINLLSPGDLTISGAISATSARTVTLTGIGRLIIGSGNTTSTLNGTLTGPTNGTGKIRIEDQSRLQFNLNIGTSNSQQLSLQNIEVAGASGPENNLRVLRAGATTTNVTTHFQNVTLMSGAVLSIDEDNTGGTPPNYFARVSLALSGNAELRRTATNSDDIDIVNVTSTGNNQLTLSADQGVTMATTLFGDVGAGVTIDVVRATLGFGDLNVTAPQVLNGFVRATTLNVGTINVFTGHNGVGGTGLSGTGGFVLSNGRILEGRVDENATILTNSIPATISVEVLAGSTATLSAGRAVDIANNNGDVRWRNVRLGAGSTLTLTRSTNQRIAADFVLLGNATVTSGSSANTFIADVDDGGAGYTLNVTGTNQFFFFGALKNTATVDYQILAQTTNFNPQTDLGAGTFTMDAGARFIHRSNSTVTLTVNPVAGAFDLPAGVTGTLQIEAGANGTTNLLTAATAINVTGTRTMSVRVNDVAVAPSILNTIGATVNVATGAALTLSTDFAGTNLAVSGTVRLNNLRLSSGATVLTIENNNVDLITDLNLLGNATFTNNDDSDEIFIGNVTGGPATLTVNGDDSTILLGLLNGNTISYEGIAAAFIIPSTNNPGAGTINLPNGFAGTLQIESGADGTNNLLTAATVVNVNGARTMSVRVNDVAVAPSILNTIGATVNVATGVALTLSSEFAGTNLAVSGTVRMSNLQLSSGATIIALENNGVDLIADLNLLGDATFSNSDNSTEIFIGNITGGAHILNTVGANVTRLLGLLNNHTVRVEGTGGLSLFGNPGAGIVELNNGFTSQLLVEAGADGTTNLLTAATVVNVNGARTMSVRVNDVAVAPSILNTIGATVNVATGVALTLSTDFAGTNLAVSGTVRMNNLQLSSGANVTAVVNNGVDLIADINLLGNATFTNNSNGTEIFLANVSSSGTLTVLGNQPTQLVGTLSNNAIVTIGATAMAVLTTETTSGSTFSLGGCKVRVEGTGGLSVLANPGEGIIELPTGFTSLLQIDAGRDGVTNLLSSLTQIVVETGRTVRGRVNEVASGPRLVNVINAQILPVPGASIILQAERGVGGDLANDGYVRFANVHFSAGSRVTPATGTAAQRMIVDAYMFGNAEFSNSHSSTLDYLGNVTSNGNLTITGTSTMQLVGTLSDNATVTIAGSNATAATLTATSELTSNTSFSLGGCTVALQGTGVTQVFVEPGLGTIDHIATAGTLELRRGRTGTTNPNLPDTTINLGTGRRINAYVNELASGGPLVNIVGARINVVGTTATIHAERDAGADLASNNGDAIFTNVVLGTGSTTTLSRASDKRICASLTLNGNATVTGAGGDNVIFVNAVTDNSNGYTLTSTGTEQIRYVGAVTGTTTILYQGVDSTELRTLTTTATQFSMAPTATFTSQTAGNVVLMVDPVAGTFNLPTGTTGELRIETGQDGAAGMLTSAVTINANGRNIRGYVQDDPAIGKTNTINATVNVAGTMSLIADRAGAAGTVFSTVLFTNVVPVDGTTLTLTRANNESLLADITATPNGVNVISGASSNARIRNVLGQPTHRLMAGTSAQALQVIGTTTATLGARTGGTLTINKASPTFVTTTGTPGLFFDGGTINLLAVAGSDLVESIGPVTVNAFSTNILNVTPVASADARVTAASLTVNALASLQYNRNTAAPHIANFIISGAPNGTVYPDVHINGTTGGSFNSTALESGFQTGLTSIPTVSTLTITGPATVQVGETAMYTVTALDSGGNVVPTYAGTVSFAISNPAVISVTPSPYTFIPGGAGDAGQHVFAVRFDAGAPTTHSLAVNDGVRAGSMLVTIQRGQPAFNWPAPTITYGDPLTAAQLNAIAQNLSGQTIPGTYTYTPAAGTVLNAGNGQTLNVQFRPVDLTNYDIVNGSTTINVLPKALTISPDNVTKNYGSPNNLTATFTGFVNGDDASDLTGLSLTSTATAASVPGMYSITAAGASSPNYTISYANNPATLTVAPAPLTATATTIIARINQPIPPLTVTYSGFVLGQDSTVLETQPVLSTTAVQGSPIADYPITFTTAPADADGHYAITTVNGLVRVFPPQPLVDNKTINAGSGVATPVALTGQSFSVNPLTFNIVTQPAHGSVVISGTNAIYTAFANYTGPDSFTFSGFDGFDNSAPGTVSITVKGPPSILSQPVFTPNPAVAGAPITASAATDNGTISWNWGDGSPEATGSTVTHTYTVPGIYNAVMTITSPEGIKTTKTISVFIGFDIAGGTGGGGGGGATPPVSGILVGGTGAGKAQKASGKLGVNYTRREKTYVQGSLGALSLPATMTQASLMNVAGTLTVGSGANAAPFQFVLNKSGKGKSTGLPKVEFNIKKKLFAFKAQRSDLTTLIESLGGAFQPGVKKGPIIDMFVPVTLQVGDSVFLAMTFQYKFQQTNKTAKGKLALTK